MDMGTCQDCGFQAKYFEPGQSSDMVQGGCPNCGSMRFQPSPTQDEMTPRNMPAAGGGDDMGGNPLQEGILADGGWKNRMKRDESFASVMSADFQHGIAPMRPSEMDFLQDNGRGDFQPCPNCGIPSKAALGLCPHCGADLEQRVNPGLPTVGKTAMDYGEEGWDDDDIYNPYQPEQSPHGVHERFIVKPDGSVLRPSDQLLQQRGSGDRVFHEDIANENGMPNGEFTQGHSLGQVNKDGTIQFVQHDTPFNAQQMQQLIEPHYPGYQVDPNLQQVSNQQRWDIPQGDPEANQLGYADKKQKEQEYMEGRGGRPFGYYDNPAFNRGGSALPDREKMYLPWNVDTEKIAQDFDVTQVIPDGPHTVEVDKDGSPLVMQHENPEVLDEAKEKLQASKLAFLPLLAEALPAAAEALGIGGAAAAEEGGMGAGLLGGGGGRGILGTIKNLIPGLGGGGQQQQAQQPQQPPVDYTNNLNTLTSSIHQMLTAADLSYPGPKDTNDPEHVDPHEKNDGDHKDWQRENETNDIGGTSEGTGDLDPEVHESLMTVLPHLLEGDASGPEVQQFIALLEAKHPEIHDVEVTPDDVQKTEKAKQIWHEHKQKQGSYPVTAPPAVQPMQQQVNPATQASCPHCGARITPGSGVCPQCNGSVIPTPTEMGQQQGMGQPMNVGMPPITGAYQGPQNAEQFRALGQILQQSGREQEAINVLLNPDQYGEELGSIQQKGTIPNMDPDQPAPPPAPPGMDPSQGGGPPGAPPPGMPMQGAVLAADSIARQCPECGSHTTALLSTEGDSSCHRCGHQWKEEGVIHEDAQATTAKVAAPHMDFHNTEGVPAADQTQAYDPSQDYGADFWKTQDGQPLVPGQEYEMYSDKYNIPDIIRVEHKTPNELTYTLTGAYNLEHKTTLTQQEAQMDGTVFTPHGQDQGQQPDPSTQSDNTGYQGSPEQDNLSTTGHTAGAKFTLMEQRQFVDEPGVARNSDKLDLSHTHYNSDLTDDFLWGF